MSVYEICNKISKLARVFHKKSYKPYDVVAVVYKNNKPINYFYKDYSLLKLKDLLTKPYEQKYVHRDFWDYSFCTSENLMLSDVEDIVSQFQNVEIEDQRRSATGFLISLIGLHNIILKTYEFKDFNINDVENFDKNIMMNLFMQFDMIINLNFKLLMLIKSVFGDRITDFLISPSGHFRFSIDDLSIIFENTPFVHEISTNIVSSIEDVDRILNYHLELLDVCDTIYSPKLITSYNAQNILLNILKLNIDLDKYQNKFFEFIDRYINKDGSVSIVFDLNNNDIEPKLDMIREYLQS